MKHLYLTILFLMGGMTCAMAQKDHSVAKDTQKNQVQLTLTDGAEKYYNTDDVQKIKFEEKQVKVVQPVGDDVYDNKVQGIAFFKAEKPAGPTKADLVGTWEAKALEAGEESFFVTFTESQLTIPGYVGPYTFEDGVLTYTVPATEWDDAYTVSQNVCLLYDNSVLVLKSPIYEDSDIEEAEVYVKQGKSPNTSDAKLDGKWFCYHRGSKDEVRCGLWINGNKAEFVIGAWATRMVGPYTYENGILYLHPTEYYFGRDPGDWGYGRIDPATLECSRWEKVSQNPGLIDELTGGGRAFPETFIFFINGDEAYSWYANIPCLYYKQ